jgi:serine/threonine protein phosphatase PrpC
MKEFQIQTFAEQGSSLMNEDVLIIDKKTNVFGVIDGATSVAPYRNSKGETGGYIAANLMASYFKNSSKNESLSKIVLEANHCLRKLMIDSGVDVNQKADLWCAAFVLIRINETNIEYVQAGDCMLFAEYQDGTIRVMTHPQVAHLDAVTIKKAIELRNQGYTSREHLLPTLRSSREKANTLSGYAVLNGDPQFVDFLEAGMVNRACLSRLYLISDGLFPKTESVDDKMDWEQMIREMDEKGLVQYGNDLIAEEEADSECWRYPRVKKSDDKTGIIIDLE